MILKLTPAETDLIGEWRLDGNVLKPDATSIRIEQLIRGHLQRLCSDSSGWDTLYRDPDDGRYWELTYPSSDSEGGGPPRLTCINLAGARAKYPIVVGETSPRS
jgi:hypothetical protein